MGNSARIILPNHIVEMEIESAIPKLSFNIPLVKGYVYDTVLIVHSRNNQKVVNAFNNVHKKIQCSVEHENY